jgi:ribosomal protein L17
MNNEIFKKLITEMRKISLSSTQKSNMRDVVLSYMDTHPIPASLQHKSRIHSPYMRFFMTAVPVFLVVFVFLGSGVSFASIASLPGDLLYPMKVGVTERVQGLFITTNKEKAHYELKLATRRLIEVEQLTAEGKLDTKSKEVVQKNFDKHSEELSLHIEALKKEDNLDEAASVNDTFADSLIAHEKIITELKTDENKDLVEPLITSVKEQVKTVSDKSIEIKQEIKTNEEIDLKDLDDEQAIDSDISAEDESVEDSLNADLGGDIKTDTIDGEKGIDSISTDTNVKEDNEKDEGNKPSSTSQLLLKKLLK